MYGSTGYSYAKKLGFNVGKKKDGETNAT